MKYGQSWAKKEVRVFHEYYVVRNRGEELMLCAETMESLFKVPDDCSEILIEIFNDVQPKLKGRWLQIKEDKGVPNDSGRWELYGSHNSVFAWFVEKKIFDKFNVVPSHGVWIWVSVTPRSKKKR